MANTKISNETLASTPLSGAEVVPGVQSGGNVKISVQQIVDTVSGATNWKKQVRAATAYHGALSSSYSEGLGIDGVTLAAGDRILIKNQNDATENGIYIVASAGAPSRAPDADTGPSYANACVFVNEGLSARTMWMCDAQGLITLGTSDLHFSQIGNEPQLEAFFHYKSDTVTVGDTSGDDESVHWSSATQTNSGELYFSDHAYLGSTMTVFYAALPAEGIIVLADTSTPRKWQAWKWTEVTDMVGCYKFKVNLLAYGGGNAYVNSENIADDELLAVTFMPLGGGGGGGGGGLTNFEESTNTASPNNSTNANRFLAVASSANADIVLSPKGNASLLRMLPDAAVTGGDKRGIYSTDFQATRTATTQVASGAYSGILAGKSNRSSGEYSTVVGGLTNTSSGFYSFIGGGSSNTSYGGYSCTPGGRGNVADGDYSSVLGAYGKAFGIAGVHVQTSQSQTVDGDSQRMSLVLRKITTNGTTTRLISNFDSVGAGNQLVLQNKSAMTVTGQVVARQSTTGDTKSWVFTASLKRATGQATTAMLATCTPTVVAADSGASSWSLSVDADTTHGGLKVDVTGEASKSIFWVCSLDAVFMIY